MALPFALGTGISGKPFTDISKSPFTDCWIYWFWEKCVCEFFDLQYFIHKSPMSKNDFNRPKRVELKMYDDLPHLVAPVIKEPSQAILALNWAVNYMEERYKTLEQYNVRNILSYNALIKEKNLPYPI